MVEELRNELYSMYRDFQVTGSFNINGRAKKLYELHKLLFGVGFCTTCPPAIAAALNACFVNWKPKTQPNPITYVFNGSKNQKKAIEKLFEKPISEIEVIEGNENYELLVKKGMLFWYGKA